MKCKNCTYFGTLGNTEETGAGLCKFYDSFEPTTIDHGCPFDAPEYTCNDCDHFGNDFGCFTCEAEDSILLEYPDGTKKRCPGFHDKRKEVWVSIVCSWVANGFDVNEELKRLETEMKEFAAKLQQRIK